MKMIKILSITFIIIVIGYALYLIAGMSSTHLPLKDYRFSISRLDFEQILIDYTNKSQDWAIEKTDSLKGNENPNCFWLALHYRQKEENLEYRIKYCEPSVKIEGKEQCLKVHVVGAFNYRTKSGGYKKSDDDVDKLVEFLDNKVLNSIVSKSEE